MITGDGGGRNYREAYNLLREAATTARTIARDDLVRVVRAELREVRNNPEVTARVEGKIAEAMAMKNPDKARRLLVDVKKELEAVHGAQHPDFARPQGIGNRPDPRAGRNTGGRQFQRRDAL